MTPEDLDRHQRTTAAADTTAPQPRNDNLSWQNDATGRTARITAEKTDAIQVQEQDRPAATPAETAGRKPFSMSYGGSSTADYIRSRISRSTR